MLRKLILTLATIATLSSALALAYKYRPGERVEQQVIQIIRTQTPSYSIGSAETGLFHRPQCPRVRHIPESERVYIFDRTIIEELDLQPCPDCNP